MTLSLGNFCTPLWLPMGCYGRHHVDQSYSGFLRERVRVSPPLQLRMSMYAYIYTAHFADAVPSDRQTFLQFEKLNQIIL